MLMRCLRAALHDANVCSGRGLVGFFLSFIFHLMMNLRWEMSGWVRVI
jgi:hypothetical protein